MMLVTVQDRCRSSGVSSCAILPLPPKRRTWFDMSMGFFCIQLAESSVQVKIVFDKLENAIEPCEVVECH